MALADLFGGPSLRWVQVMVVSVQGSGSSRSLTVRWNGGNIPGVRFLLSYTPVLNQYVEALITEDRGLMVLGAATAPVNQGGGEPGDPYIAAQPLASARTEVKIIYVFQTLDPPTDLAGVQFEVVTAAVGKSSGVLGVIDGDLNVITEYPFSVTSTALNQTHWVDIPLGWVELMSGDNIGVGIALLAQGDPALLSRFAIGPGTLMYVPLF